jgi:hypothetical protein
MESEDTELCFLNHDSEWNYVLTFTPQRFAPRVRASFTIGQEARWDP